MLDGQDAGEGFVVAPIGGDDEPVLRVRDVHKRFGAVQVLRGIDLELRRGEILALVGENGAGKSTLVQCIARTYAADSGTVEMGGQPLATDPLAARDQGVAVVWQDLALCDNLTAVANLFLGNERDGGVFLDEFAMADEARALFERLHITIASPHQPVGTLSGGQRQLRGHRPGRAAPTVGARARRAHRRPRHDRDPGGRAAAGRAARRRARRCCSCRTASIRCSAWSIASPCCARAASSPRCRRSRSTPTT